MSVAIKRKKIKTYILIHVYFFR